MPRPTKKIAVQQYVLECRWLSIGQLEWTLLKVQFCDTSESILRDALADIAVPIEQPFAGVGTKSLEQLEASLVAMAEAYPAQPAQCRAIVIAAKDRARFAALNAKAAPEKRALKAEMVEWMLVWLGDPAMFRTWVQLRKRAGLLQVE